MRRLCTTSSQAGTQDDMSESFLIQNCHVGRSRRDDATVALVQSADMTVVVGR